MKDFSPDAKETIATWLLEAARKERATRLPVGFKPVRAQAQVKQSRGGRQIYERLRR